MKRVDRRQIVKLTAVRLAALQRIAERHRDENYGVRPVSIADSIAPRKFGWSPQGATLWVGQLLHAFLSAGVLRQNRNPDGLLFWEITSRGREYLQTAKIGEVVRTSR